MCLLLSLIWEWVVTFRVLCEPRCRRYSRRSSRQGNLPTTCLHGLKQILDNDIPIVLVSRSFNGIVSPVYAYEGGGADLFEKGVIFSNGLNGPKARLKLLVGLSQNMNHQN